MAATAISVSSRQLQLWLLAGEKRVHTSTTDFPFLIFISISKFSMRIRCSPKPCSWTVSVLCWVQHKRNTDSTKCTASQTWPTVVSAVAPSAFSLPCINYPCLCCSSSQSSACLPPSSSWMLAKGCSPVHCCGSRCQSTCDVPGITRRTE